MKRTLIVLLVIAFVPMLSSCFAIGKKVAKGTGEVVGGTIEGVGKGALDVMEGVGEGAADFGKGTAEVAVGTAKTTGYTLVGQGEDSVESGKETTEAGRKGLKGLIQKPLEGVGKGLQSIDRSIKEVTGNEDIK